MSKTYNRLYDDMSRNLEYWQAPKEIYPKRASDDISQPTQSTTKIDTSNAAQKLAELRAKKSQ